MLFHKLLPLLALGLNLLLLGSALTSDRRNHRNLVFAHLAGGLAVWNLGVFGLRTTSDPTLAMLWEQFLHLGVIPIPALFYHYAVAFLDLPRRQPGLIVGYALCGGFLAVSLTPLFLAGVRATPWGFVPESGPLYGLFVLYFQGYLLFGIARLVAAYRRPLSSVKRNRTLLVICGALVSLVGGVVDFVRFIANLEWLYPLGIPTNAVFAVALGVAIVRYRLMDLGALIRRALLYLLTAVALAPVLFLGLHAVDYFLVSRQTEPAIMPWQVDVLTRDAAVLLVIFTIALPFLRRLEIVLEQLIFRREHGVRDALIELSKMLPAVVEPVGVGRVLTEGLVARVPALHATLFVPDPGTGDFTPGPSAVSEAAERSPALEPPDETLRAWLRMAGRALAVGDAPLHPQAHGGMQTTLARLELEGVALVLPIAAETQLVGVLALGEKVSGEVYGDGEIELLETLMRETGIVLRNAGLYRDLEQQMDSLRRAQEQLVRSAKLAAIGELAASVAHELNSPLMVISGRGQLLLRQLPDGSPHADPLTVMVDEAHRASGIVRNMLDFARRRDTSVQRITLDEVIDRALALLEARLERARVDVARIFDGGLPEVAGDRDQLTQVFINLIANAADAMPGGGVVTIETEGRGTGADTGAETAVVAVRDTGGGMPPEVAARIFEPFYTTKAEGAGTGLGLSVSLGIVRQHGGTIEVETAAGAGTTMRVVLPACSTALPPAPTLAGEIAVNGHRR